MEENKYNRGKIYKLTDNGYNKCYIGSTTETLSNRMAKHRNAYRRYRNNDAKRTTCFDIFEEFGMENCKAELIESYPCASKEELNAREGYYIRNTECVNKLIAGRKWKEYYDDTRELKLDYAKKYREQNADKVKAREKAYRESHKHEKAERDKSYRERKKEKIAEHRKQYYQQNQEKLKAYHRQRTQCDCGGHFTITHKNRHYDTQKHKDWQEKQNL